MAVQGLSFHIGKIPTTSVAFALAAVLALALSLAAALVGLSNRNRPAPPVVTAADDLAARNQRIAFFEARAAADPIDFVSLNVLAGQYLQRARETGDIGDYQRAETAASTSLSILSKDNYGGSLSLASVRLVQHDFAAALELAEQAIAVKPSEADPYGLRGDAYLGQGRYDEAGRDYQKMLELAPTLSALSRLATLAFIQGDLLNAEDYWRQSLEGGNNGLPRENLAWARLQLGGLYFSQGRLAEAESQYRQSLALFPDYPQALAALGAVRAAQGRLPDAAALYEDAQARLPLPQHVIALGNVYAADGRSDAARSQYELVGAIDQLYRANGVNTDLQLALFYADHDLNLPDALALAQNAYDASSGVYAADALAWALYKNGRYEEAAAMSRQALRLGTPEAAFHYHAGVISHALSRSDDARAQLKQALQINPHFSLLHAADARRLLDTLGGGK